MTKLDEIAINVELVLISLIEGAALVTLAENSVGLLHGPNWYQYLPYILSGLAILLVFWAQSILHAVSFIRWPIRIEHMFLYFVSAFLQMIAYSSITDINAWFFWWTAFSLVALLMYFVDLYILRDSYPAFEKISGGEEFFETIVTRHLYEMKVLVPVALAFNFLACAVAFYEPQWFTSPLYYMIPGCLQLAVSIGALYDCTKNFRTRSIMIAKIHA